MRQKFGRFLGASDEDFEILWSFFSVRSYYAEKKESHWLLKSIPAIKRIFS